ncbi:unnamed protein product [Sphagnum tenellum]
MGIIITGHKWSGRINPLHCDKLEVYSEHKGNASSYIIDISGGENRPFRVQSATCIPWGTLAYPRNVTGRMPKAITAWVNDFLKNKENVL